MHRILPGGYLAQHLDFNSLNMEPQNQWRRVNVLLYLSDCGPGGELRLFGQDGRERVSISPKPNRMVVFESTERSWHGHPYPLQVRLTTGSRVACGVRSSVGPLQCTTLQWSPQRSPHQSTTPLCGDPQLAQPSANDMNGIPSTTHVCKVRMRGQTGGNPPKMHKA
jgi:hypothetical protein